MRFERLLTTVDTHTEGMNTRVVTGGVPNIPGKTMPEKVTFFKENLDYIRTALLNEPRGCMSSFGGVLTPPVTDEAAFGVIWIGMGKTPRYIDMCGHGTMGVVTIAIETGLVEPREPVTEVTIDTPAGLVHARANVENGRVKSVTLQNVPSFMYKTVSFKVPELGELKADVAFGGNNFPVIEAKDLGITSSIADIKGALSLIVRVIASFNEQVKVQHPEKDYIKGISGVLVSDKPANPKATVKNICVTPLGTVDRSPCGTGTSCRMAIQYAKGELKLGEDFVTESIIGTLYHGKLLEETRVGGLTAVVPEVTGRAFITGLHEFVLADDDPFKHGFLL